MRETGFNSMLHSSAHLLNRRCVLWGTGMPRRCPALGGELQDRGQERLPRRQTVS